VPKYENKNINRCEAENKSHKYYHAEEACTNWIWWLLMRIKGYQIGTLFNDLTIIIKIQRDSNIFQSWVVFLVIYISKTDQCHLDWNLFQLVSRTSLNRLHTLETSNVEADILASVQMCTDKMMNIFSSMVSASQINDKCSSLWLIANYLRMLSSNLKSCLMRYNKKYLF